MDVEDVSSFTPVTRCNGPLESAQSVEGTGGAVRQWAIRVTCLGRDCLMTGVAVVTAFFINMQHSAFLGYRAKATCCEAPISESGVQIEVYRSHQGL